MTRSPDIVRSEGTVTSEARAALLGHGAVTLWFTGLPGSGKSTLAHAVAEQLVATGVLAFVLDGDNLRFGLNSDLGFSPEDRAENIRRAGEVSALLHEAGAVVLASFVSPYRSDRDGVRALHGPGAFVEIFVDAPLQICEQRDPKGLYSRARSGAITHFTGVSAPYEKPINPELHIRTAEIDIAEAVALITAEVLERIQHSGKRSTSSGTSTRGTSRAHH